MHVPDDRRYTEAHEWALEAAEGRIRIGITDFAQDALGDIVYVDLPDVGTAVSAGDTLAEVESTKSVGEVYAPLAGTIVAVNTDLDDHPELINSDPYSAGWIVEVEPTDNGLAALLDAAAYSAFTEAD